LSAGITAVPLSMRAEGLIERLLGSADGLFDFQRSERADED
jgi:hypothetical protein